MEKVDRVCFTCERERLKPSELVYRKKPGTEETGKCAFCGQRKFSAEYIIRYGRDPGPRAEGQGHRKRTATEPSEADPALRGRAAERASFPAHREARRYEACEDDKKGEDGTWIQMR